LNPNWNPYGAKETPRRSAMSRRPDGEEFFLAATCEAVFFTTSVIATSLPVAPPNRHLR
jgi:hypothetical protein